MLKKLIYLFLFSGQFVPRIYGADLVLVINTLECSNYYRSAPLLTDLKENFNIKFIFPEYESKIAVKYLDQKFDLRWDKYDITFNDSLYGLYRKNMTSECVYFPTGAKTPLMSFPLSQLQMSFFILINIPSNIKVDTIPVPDFLFSGDMSFSKDSMHLYILEAQFGNILQLNNQTYAQKIISLSDSITYDEATQMVLTRDEINISNDIEKGLKDSRSLIKRQLSFTHITSYDGQLYVKACLDYYRKDKENITTITTKNFIIKFRPHDFSGKKIIPIPAQKEFANSYAPILINRDTFYMSVLLRNSSQIPADQKYLIGKYIYEKDSLHFIGFHKSIHLPEEYQRLNFNYNFLNFHTYDNYFNPVYSKTINNINGSHFSILLLPDIDTVAGSKFPAVKTNYMMLNFAVEDPITNFIVKFNDGKVKLFSYDYTHNLPFNQIELPAKINTSWPNEDFFKFTSINSFVHINLRNDFIVKYYW